MSKVRVDVTATARFREVDRDRTAPSDLQAIVQRKVEDALVDSGATDVEVTAEARDG